jgi:hypothetical protein
MGFESGEEGVIPTAYESERVAGFDHDAKHGDPDERPVFADSCAAAGLSRGSALTRRSIIPGSNG